MVVVSANDEPLSNDTGGGSRLVEIASRIANGGRVRWRLLGVTIVGGALFAFIEGVIAFLLALADIPVRLLGWLGSFLAALIDVVVGVYPLLVSGAFEESLAFVEGAGFAGYFVALAIGLATLFILSWVVSRVR